MGKKLKTGKARRDKFYRLAKETGYRARSAFKLLQLNRKFEFLQKSRVCVDLCAAPGSWLQVAANHMPISSVIIGVDLVPIKSIYGVTTFQEDITTEKCKQLIKKELQTWQADVVLHDGAPNVGKSWVHDAFAQVELTLASLKLATQFLKKDGWFVTKVFRSKDYHALLWVFGQMFKKVHATKPQASRNESAEIFVVCQGYKAPDKLDPKFLDPKYVFQDVGPEPKKPINLIHPEKEKRKAEGYADGDYTLHHKVKVTDFITAENHLELLANCNQLVFDSRAIANHPLTTNEIKECCKDIKLLGKKDLRDILTWRKKLKQSLEKILQAKEEEEKQRQQQQQSDEEEEDMDVGADQNIQKPVDIEELNLDSESDNDDVDDEKVQGDDDDADNGDDGKGSGSDEEEKVKEHLAELKEEERKTLKRKKKKVLKEKRKLRDKLSLNMVIPGDRLDVTDDMSLFDLKKIKSKKELKDVEEEDLSDHEGVDIEAGEVPEKSRKFMMAYDRYGEQHLDAGFSDSEEEEGGQEVEETDESDEDVNEESEPVENNPLVVDLEKNEISNSQKTDRWFNKDVFADLEAEEDENVEIEKMMEDYKKRGGVVLGKETKLSKKAKKNEKKKKKKDISDEDEDIQRDNKPAAKKDKKTLKKEEATKKNSQNTTKKKINTTQTNDDKMDIADSASDAEDNISNKEDDDDDFSDSSSDTNSEGSSDSEYDVYPQYIQRMKKSSKDVVQNKSAKDGFEIVPEETATKQNTRLDPVSLALGEELIKSSKRRRELEEESYNRYTFEDDNLPAWFTQDEAKHMRKPLPVSKAKIEAYKERMKAINARPIKKIAEAEARKKKKMMRKLERARKKAESINDALDTSDKEKWKAIKEVYKKAGLLKHKKEDIAYVVARRGAGKKVSRPPGIKGRFKVVDPRLKKDLRNSKIRDKNLKKKGKVPKNINKNKKKGKK